MNINQLMQQAQKMQKDMKKSQEEVSNMIFTSKQELVEVEMDGNKKVKKITINKDIEKDDIEALEDMILISINDCINQVDKTMENKLGKYANMMPGLF
ncbi:MAG: YbaB/EbfC family nucleoid-associated protein [Bacilli bacterium]|nr:YbaB/EbfC family nucleoid-associated protein [Bacilli bacterium]